MVARARKSRVAASQEVEDDPLSLVQRREVEWVSMGFPDVFVDHPGLDKGWELANCYTYTIGVAVWTRLHTVPLALKQVLQL